MPARRRNTTAAPSEQPPLVRLRVPADKNYVVLIRSAAAHLAARNGLDQAAIIDLRLAVNEACALLLVPGSAPAGPAGGVELEAVFEQTADSLDVVVSTGLVGEPRPDRDAYGWVILSALVDDLSWRSDGTTAQVGFAKRREE